MRKGDAAQSGQPTDPGDVEATRAFARHAVEQADGILRAREILERRLLEKRHGGGFQGARPGGPSSGGAPVAGKFSPKPIRPGGRRGRG